MSMTEGGLPLERRIGAVVAVSAGSLLWTFDLNVANIALPAISKEMGLEPFEAVSVVTMYNLVLAMALLPFAAIGDTIGYRRVFVSGLILYVVGAVGCQIATTFPLLLAARIVQALASALVISVSLGLIRNIWPPSMLGRGMGINTLASAGGAALAPVVGGFLIDAVSWQSAFAAAMPMVLLALPLARLLPELERLPQAYDKVGAFLCAATFGLLILGLQLFSTKNSWPIAVGLVSAGAAVAVLFVWHELKVSLPVLPVDLLQHSSLTLTLSAGFLATLAVTFLMLHLPFELHRLGYSAAVIGTMIAPYVFASLVAAPAAVMISDKISPNVIGLCGLLMGTLASFAFITLPGDLSYFDIAWRTGVAGFGFSAFLATNGRIMVAAAPRARVAGASSLLGTTRKFGAALGAAAFGVLSALSPGGVGVVPVIVILSLLSLICAAARLFVSQVLTAE